MSRNKEIDGNRWKTRKGRMTEQNQKTTERDRTDGNSHRTHGNGREQAECHGKAGERWRRSEKNTVHDSGGTFTISCSQLFPPWHFTTYFKQEKMVSKIITESVHSPAESDKSVEAQLQADHHSNLYLSLEEAGR